MIWQCCETRQSPKEHAKPQGARTVRRARKPLAVPPFASQIVNDKLSFHPNNSFSNRTEHLALLDSEARLIPHSRPWIALLLDGWKGTAQPSFTTPTRNTVKSCTSPGLPGANEFYLKASMDITLSPLLHTQVSRSGGFRYNFQSNRLLEIPQGSVCRFSSHHLDKHFIQDPCIFFTATL